MECRNWETNWFRVGSKTNSQMNGANHNYCANPDFDSHGPWCYTTDSDTPWEVISIYSMKQIILFYFQYCEIPKCPDCSQRVQGSRNSNDIRNKKLNCYFSASMISNSGISNFCFAKNCWKTTWVTLIKHIA
jgi:hypothetical protein